MKKLFAVLFCSFVMSGYVFADELSYEIDPVATAKAPWKVGERIVKESDCEDIVFYREFLGITPSGLVVVQDFYLSGKKLSNPFLTTVMDAGGTAEGSCPKVIEGIYTQWYESGQIEGKGNYRDGKLEGLATSWYENGQKKTMVNFEKDKAKGLATSWHENGQKQLEGHINNDKEVGIWREWDEKGSLIEEKDYGTPED